VDRTRPALPPPDLVLLVAVGGAVGAVARWLLEDAFPFTSGSFPWTTFAINVSGSLLLALIPASSWLRHHRLMPPLLGTGVLGGYTTLSTYSEETRTLLASGHVALAMTYLLGTLASCLVVVALADLLTTRESRAEVEAEEGDL
jgi:CrcB protein